MFRGIFNYGLKRNFLNALGFYIIHLIIFVALAFSVGLIEVASNISADSFPVIDLWWQCVVCVLVALISFLIIRAKHQLRPGYAVLVVLSGVLSLVAPAIGLVLSAYLTTIGAESPASIR